MGTTLGTKDPDVPPVQPERLVHLNNGRAKLSIDGKVTMLEPETAARLLNRNLIYACPRCVDPLVGGVCYHIVSENVWAEIERIIYNPRDS